jgi:hypothetical protein
VITARFTTRCGCTKILNISDPMQYYEIPLETDLSVLGKVDYEYYPVKCRRFEYVGREGRLHEYLEVVTP